jgi:hypothetical protein
MKVVRISCGVLAAAVLLNASFVSGATVKDSAQAFSGYVTDGSGVEGIAGAVVSIEWNVVEADATNPARPAPTVLAVWQTRTDEKGAFEIPDVSEQLVLPPGTTAAPGAFPQLQVFAIGQEPYRVPGLSKFVSISDAGRISIRWPEDVTVLRMISLPGSEEFMTTQTELWYAELRRAVRQEVWPDGEKQAIASYRPLLDLMSETCYLYRLYGISTPACERAKVEFALKEPTPQREEVDWPHPQG